MTKLYTFLPKPKYTVEFRKILEAHVRVGRPAVVFAEPLVKTSPTDKKPFVHSYMYWFYGDAFTARLLVLPDQKKGVDEFLSVAATVVEVPTE